ncbi:MAG: SDR family NAD(P)-dependent oxidoreductase [Actinomycetia bacterium]|nr:SDR family NAD(P)-dependent oxidoreductase [Actinomycetes bacterium]
MNTRTALVTGATSGLGFEAAGQLAEAGWSRVTITGRDAARAKAAAVQLRERTGKDVFETLVVDLNKSESVQQAASELARRHDTIDFLLLNAGMVAGSQLVKTQEDIEITFASSLIGHHQLTMQLLENELLADDARIVIAGSEAARGDVPTFNPTDLGDFANEHFDGDMSAGAEALIRGDTIKFKSATAYSNAKVFVAWWSAQLATKLPEGMTVNTVSPGSAPGTDAGRNASGVLKYVMLPLFKLAPKRLGMSASVPVAANRYLEVANLEDGTTGQFFASAPKKMTGPIEAMQQSHIHDATAQTAAWSAVVKVSGGIDYPVSV